MRFHKKIFEWCTCVSFSLPLHNRVITDPLIFRCDQIELIYSFGKILAELL